MQPPSQLTSIWRRRPGDGPARGRRPSLWAFLLKSHSHLRAEHILGLRNSFNQPLCPNFNPEVRQQSPLEQPRRFCPRPTSPPSLRTDPPSLTQSRPRRSEERHGGLSRPHSLWSIRHFFLWSKRTILGHLKWSRPGELCWARGGGGF